MIEYDKLLNTLYKIYLVSGKQFAVLSENKFAADLLDGFIGEPYYMDTSEGTGWCYDGKLIVRYVIDMEYEQYNEFAPYFYELIEKRT